MGFNSAFKRLTSIFWVCCCFCVSCSIAAKWRLDTLWVKWQSNR